MTHIGDQIATAVRWLDQQSPSSSLPNSRGFVSSAHFPRLVSPLGINPAAFWTDRFVGVESDPLGAPILLLLRPSGAPEPLQCVEAEINGVGQLSRWYFRADGSWDHAEFPGGRTVRPGTSDEIQSMLLADPRLTPRSP